jgi:hypothetical protein
MDSAELIGSADEAATGRAVGAHRLVARHVGRLGIHRRVDNELAIGAKRDFDCASPGGRCGCIALQRPCLVGGRQWRQEKNGLMPHGSSVIFCSPLRSVRLRPGMVNQQRSPVAACGRSRDLRIELPLVVPGPPDKRESRNRSGFPVSIRPPHLRCCASSTICACSATGALTLRKRILSSSTKTANAIEK